MSHESKGLVPKRPGGLLVGQPVKGPDGKWHDQFGEEISPDLSKDTEWSAKFWSHQPKGMREVMIENIEAAEGGGRLSIMISSEGGDLPDIDKERLSAYRQLVRELGYEVGEFEINRAPGGAGTAVMKFSRK